MGRPTAGCGEQAGSSWEVGVSPGVHQCVPYPGAGVGGGCLYDSLSRFLLGPGSCVLLVDFSLETAPD